MTDEQLDLIIELVSEALGKADPRADAKRVQKVADALNELTLERDRRKTSGRWEPNPIDTYSAISYRRATT